MGSQTPNNRMELWVKMIAMVGGIISAAGLIVTLYQSTTQNETELMWKKSMLAKELIDSLISDSQAMDAMRMIDWNGREFHLGEGLKERICREQVMGALDPENDDFLDKKGIFIREAFDRLFYHMGRIQRSLKTELINLEDVSTPLTYYVGQILSCHAKQYETYMEHLHHEDAKKLLEAFQPSECDPSKKALKCSSLVTR